ncbi:MAG: ABC transporter permease [Candidatus Dojkabacteria bacterium]|nr:MAG: ABC transporter permease [Candidatus Dojkabacteria bacterium]
MKKLKIGASTKRWFNPHNIAGKLRAATFELNYIVRFLFIVNVYVVTRTIQKILAIRIFPSLVASHYNIFALKTFAFLNRVGDMKRYPNNMTILTILDLALKNLKFKRSRAFITVSGVSLGIATIVFLVSLGFGLQELVISRAISLKEMRQAEVDTQPGSKLKLNDSAVTDIKKISEVDEVFPVIAVVGKVEYSESTSDIAIYAVPGGYLEESAINIVEGTLFDGKMAVAGEGEQDVLGIGTYSGHPGLDNYLGNVIMGESEPVWLAVRVTPDKDSRLLGWTNARLLKDKAASHVSGGKYLYADEEKNDWFYGHMPLWAKGRCSEECADTIYEPVRDDRGYQTNEWGYIENQYLEYQSTIVPKPSEEGLSSAVLGASLELSDTVDLEFIEIDDEEETTENVVEKVNLAANAERVVIVNRSVLNLLGVSEQEAVGRKLKLGYSVTNELISEAGSRIESVPEEYTIVGVTSDESSPFAFVPITDLKGIGVANYSQLRVVAESNEALSDIRKKIESLGFATSSVADTKEQIDQFFATARIILALVGSFALAVACLGMFNTLTVSLLERTREVGLLRAMGMRPEEVRMLFLSESMIMGFYGGVGGLLLGFFIGKLLSIALSFLSISKGYGFIDVTNIPILLALGVVMISFFVGFATGLYPANRATKISALNALRYE